ncbi:putative receptor-like protein kinase [Colletotrichum tanaceti]|uniref:Putative receptor-like protein kinase n=1 Tax=Colletotrichum tanaceti TaxID=1306861 RepID=A0A4U6XIA7_9PEZI|nr:putative receptor-like protein kinase [Colletotrichum tanaceti]TKW55082.1 putative receptor-like protein kinase [Colletotrichum tanaceti]
MAEEREVIVIERYCPPGVKKIIAAGGSAFIGEVDDYTVFKYPLRAGDELTLSRLDTEIQLLEVVGPHERIIQLKGFSETGLYLERAVNGSVAQHLESANPPPMQRRLSWCREAVEAVAWVHTKGVLHCDINPTNLLLDCEFHVKLADFQGQQLSPDGSGTILLDGCSSESTRFFCPREDEFNGDVRTELFALGFRPVLGLNRRQLPVGGNASGGPNMVLAMLDAHIPLYRVNTPMSLCRSGLVRWRNVPLKSFPFTCVKMKVNVIAATVLAAFSAGAFAHDERAERPAGVPASFPTGFPIGERPNHVPGAAKPSGGFGGGFPGFGNGERPSGFPFGPKGPRPTQVPGAAKPSGGFGGAFPGFGGHSGFLTRTRGEAAGAGFGAQATETPFPTGTQPDGARPTGEGKGKGKGKGKGRGKGKGKNHGTGALPTGVRPTRVPGAAKPSGGFGGGFPGFGGQRPSGAPPGAAPTEAPEAKPTYA